MPVGASSTNIPGDFKPLIIGAGAVVREYYLPAFERLGLLTSTTVVDLSNARLDGLRQDFDGIEILAGDFRALFDGGRLPGACTAAFVALPNSLHEDAAGCALDADLNVLCEKPLALESNACLRLARRASANGCFMGVNMVRRLLPCISAVREALDQGLIGNVLSVEVEDGAPFAWLSDSGSFFQPENGGVLADMGVHYLDLFRWLFGQLDPIDYRDDWAGGVEANASFRLRGSSGVSIQILLSRTRNLRNTMVFKGDRGELIVEKEKHDRATWRPSDGKMEASFRPINSFSSGEWPATLHSCFVEQFFRFAIGSFAGCDSFVSATDSASTIALIEWAYGHRPSCVPLAPYGSATDRPGLEPDKALITGGTGFIGSHLAKRLTALGFTDIVSPVRNYRTCSNLAVCPVDLRRVDLLDYEQVRAAVRGVRYVVHLAYGRDGTDGHRVTIRGTQNIVEAAIANGCESVVVLSTVYVFGQPASVVVDESWPYHPWGGDYGLGKAEMERWCLKRSQNASNTRIVVLNPSCVYGSGGRTYTEMPLRMASDGAFCWIEGGRGAANITYIDNLIDAIVLSLTCAKASGHRIIINDSSTTWRQFLTPLLGQFADEMPSYSRKDLLDFERRSPKYGWTDLLPIFLSDPRARDVLRRSHLYRLYSALARRRNLLVDEHARTLGGKSQELRKEIHPPIWLADLFGPASTVFSAAKATSLLGWSPRVGLEEGQALAQRWLSDPGSRLEGSRA